MQRTVAPLFLEAHHLESLEHTKTHPTELKATEVSKMPDREFRSCLAKTEKLKKSKENTDRQMGSV